MAAIILFCYLLSWFSTRGAKPEPLAVRGVLKKGTWATVFMAGQERFDRVRFIGFTSSESLKTHIPFDLVGMVILEDPTGRRFLVRAKAIRMIEIAPESAEPVAEAIPGG